ncbi:GDSL esterase/lipase At1g59030 [Brassica napus]|uniref:GDSL esterase/lipase At1g59030 n=1 Tax=Brassica napus TaxID=3708 RepID=UPI0020787FB2|nr:GDSL esterase/lipase At1g59030 [Brassica napus]
MKLQLLWLALVFIAVETNAAKQGKNATIPALIVFGDSIMDTGNNNRLPTLLKCNFPPYGKDFPGGLATGRFSDGRVPSDLIAEKLGIAKSLPAFMNPNLKPQDLLKGVTFASGGTGYDPLTAKIMELHKLGAKKIGVFSAVPVGCVPLQRTVFGGMFTRGCVKPLNDMAKQFNARLSPALESLDKELDGVILYINVYDTLFNMIQHPSKYGFEVADRGCCGRGSLAISYMCNSLNPFTCSNSSAYIFWDSYHPTERAYQVMVDNLLDKYLSKIY